MYEKPQYFTPNGYKRSAKNPFKKNEKQVVSAKNSQFAQELLARKKRKKTIDEKTAKLIAEAIKTMLHSND